MNGQLVSPMAALWHNVWVRLSLISLCVAVFLSYVGALDTLKIPFVTRLFYWMGAILIGSYVAIMVSKVEDRLDLEPYWRAKLLVFVVMCLLITLGIWVYTALYFARGFELSHLLALFPSVSVISMVMMVLAELTTPKATLTHAHSSNDQEPLGISNKAAFRPQFWAQLPPSHSDAELIAIRAEDHYLRLFTTKGETLILLSLHEAVTQLEGIEGARTHRSWWVAKAHVLGHSRRGGALSLKMTGDLDIPISRKATPTLRDAGWV